METYDYKEICDLKMFTYPMPFEAIFTTICLTLICSHDLPNFCPL